MTSYKLGHLRAGCHPKTGTPLAQGARGSQARVFPFGEVALDAKYGDLEVIPD